MINYGELAGLDGYRAAFPNALAGLDDATATEVIAIVHNEVLEGWEPSEADVSRVRGFVTADGPSRRPAAEVLAELLASRKDSA
ncbi:MAG: hypothetical protein Q4G50_13295 [Corynebacterium sp.]|uniref:hypothetical protein n=1 Tax=Corynebacterium sp. TaxID=1720 RepID=UPI0026DF19BD|nr:hypothetical protein [Corynebacterium sp.]MDO5670959.1 hypothetical protein [Corynebacterium sp.]